MQKIVAWIVVGATFLVGIVALPIASAGPLEDADSAYSRGDYAAALRLLRPLAERGDATAQFALGVMYDKGQGVPQDDGAAAQWCRKAAEQGNASAQVVLGAMYENGQGVAQDYVQAHMWFDVALSRFSASDKDERGEAVRARDTVAALMTPAQIAKAQKLAREWRPK